MPEELYKELGSPEELRQLNRWIIRFDLSDAELYAVIVLIGDTIWGDIDLDEFWQKLQSAVLKDNDAKRDLAVAIANNRFLFYKKDIGDVEGFIRRLGGQVLSPAARPRVIEKSPEDVAAELAKYDWSKIVGIERRALLEELGVSLKELVKWLGERK